MANGAQSERAKFAANRTFDPHRTNNNGAGRAASVFEPPSSHGFHTSRRAGSLGSSNSRTQCHLTFSSCDAWTYRLGEAFAGVLF